MEYLLGITGCLPYIGIGLAASRFLVYMSLRSAQLFSPFCPFYCSFIMNSIRSVTIPFIMLRHFTLDNGKVGNNMIFGPMEAIGDVTTT